MAAIAIVIGVVYFQLGSAEFYNLGLHVTDRYIPL